VAQYAEKAHVALAEILQNRPEISLLVIGNDLIATAGRLMLRVRRRISRISCEF